MSTDRPATTDPAEVAPVHTGGNAEDCPACDGRSDLPYPWICPGKDLTASGREFAVRASEAPRGDGSPTPDVGAVRGGEGGSAAESEPRGIVGPGYDAVWTYIRTHPGDAYRNAAIWRAVEAFRDAVIPAIRAQVADEIACDICEPMDDCDRPSCPDCIRHEYAQRLARRIRGGQ